MDKSLLQKYAPRDDARAADGDVEDLSTVDLDGFGYLRGIRDRAVMLELRKKSGDCLAISYAFIDRIEYDPSTGIRVHAGSTTVTIKGKNLNAEASPGHRLFEGLARHRVPWIQEASQEHTMTAPEETCLVETVDW